MASGAKRWGRELSRKAIHMTTGLIPLAYAFLDHRPWFIALLVVISVTMLALEFLRHREGLAQRLFKHHFNFMLRSHEQGARWLGATHYCLASLCCVVLFPKQIAVLAMLYLAVGDTAASLVGKAWGRIKIGNKSLEGTLAFGVACSLVAMIAHSMGTGYALTGAIIAAWVAALVELLIPRLDDNWTIPISAACTMMILRSL